MATHAEAGVLAPADVKRARRVWLVISLAALAFLALCALSATGAAGWLGSLTTSQAARLQLLQGAQLSVQRSHLLAPELISSNTDLNEGDEARTGSDTSAFMQLLFDGSTIRTYFDTSVRIERLRTSQFFSSLKEASLYLESGTLVMATAKLDGYSSANFTIDTDNGVVSVAPDSTVRVQISDEGDQKVVQVVVDLGSAIVQSHSGQVIVRPSSMALIKGDSAPQGPLPAEQEVIRDGNFTEQATSGAEETENGGLGIAGWLPIRAQGPDVSVEPSSSVTLTVITESLPGLGSVNSVEMARVSSSSRYAQVGIRQDLNQPADFLKSIELRASVRIWQQSAAVGGPQGNVFPLTIRVVYTDSEGQSHEWRHVYYYLGGGVDSSQATKVVQGVWTDTGPFVIKSDSVGKDIAVINSVEIFGYGNQFQSWVTGVSLVAR